MLDYYMIQEGSCDFCIKFFGFEDLFCFVNFYVTIWFHLWALALWFFFCWLIMGSFFCWLNMLFSLMDSVT